MTTLGSGSSRSNCLVFSCRDMSTILIHRGGRHGGVFGGGRRGDIRGSGESHRCQSLDLLVGHPCPRLAVVEVRLQRLKGLLLSQAPLVQIEVVFDGYGAVAVGLIEGTKFLKALIPREEVGGLYHAAAPLGGAADLPAEANGVEEGEALVGHGRLGALLAVVALLPAELLLVALGMDPPAKGRVGNVRDGDVAVPMLGLVLLELLQALQPRVLLDLELKSHLLEGGHAGADGLLDGALLRRVVPGCGGGGRRGGRGHSLLPLLGHVLHVHPHLLLGDGLARPLPLLHRHVRAALAVDPLGQLGVVLVPVGDVAVPVGLLVQLELVEAAVPGVVESTLPVGRPLEPRLLKEADPFGVHGTPGQPFGGRVVAFLLELGLLAKELVLLAHVVAPLAEGRVGLVPDVDVAMAVLCLELLELLETICACVRFIHACTVPVCDWDACRKDRWCETS
mmetsp:Transcript_10727/g.30170  ORF Transcript_10727/g.30170 Transcript_10727/m.30170 type:complete len:451 (+) Transcript_10727:283-1635(+)